MDGQKTFEGMLGSAYDCTRYTYHETALAIVQTSEWWMLECLQVSGNDVDWDLDHTLSRVLWARASVFPWT